MTLAIAGDGRRDPGDCRRRLCPEREIPASEVVQRRTMVFTEDDEDEQFFINGKQFDADRVDVQPKLGTVEEWTLRNTSSEQHPFHIHVNDFQVISIDGEPVRRARACRTRSRCYRSKDVVIRTRFTDFTGKFVFHCHILNHEDNGMMAVVEVVPGTRLGVSASRGARACRCGPLSVRDREHLVDLGAAVLEAERGRRPCRGATRGPVPRRPRRPRRPSSLRGCGPTAAASARSARAGSRRAAPRSPDCCIRETTRSDLVQLAVGEHVAVDEAAPAEARRGACRRGRLMPWFSSRPPGRAARTAA